jgi:hypothetical protein
LEFDIRKITTNGTEKLILFFRDKHKGRTPMHIRGAGIQKIVSLMATLIGLDLNSEHLYILFDEPENSLHADAQHMLRSFLEELATFEMVQVIYATHSTSMINTMRSHSIRLLERDNRDGKATSIINNRPISENLYPVRSSLGISPGDSLLYAPITLVVEGYTEIFGLPILLKRLYEENIEGFQQVDELLAQTHLLDGQGDSFEYKCRLAKSQGAQPLIFVDGDKNRKVEKVKEKYPDVPIIRLKQGQEFEEIVSKDTYLNALRELIGKEFVSDDFEKWEKAANLPPQMMFSKRVERWLQDKFPDVRFDKPLVMKKALEIADLSEIDLRPFLELIENMTELLRF